MQYINIQVLIPLSYSSFIAEMQNGPECPFNSLENNTVDSLYCMLYFSFPKCTKTHLRACTISKIFQGWGEMLNSPKAKSWLRAWLICINLKFTVDFDSVTFCYAQGIDVASNVLRCSNEVSMLFDCLTCKFVWFLCPSASHLPLEWVNPPSNEEKQRKKQRL